MSSSASGPAFLGGAILGFACTAIAAAADTPPLTPAPVEMRLIDISLNLMTAAGGSTADDDDIESLQSGHHDPHKRGFSVQQMELVLAGAVDPYFTAQANIVGTTEGFELEEAYAESSSLLFGLQAKVGYFLTEFGRTNATHPHVSPWLTRPVVATRFFGGDGTRAGGLRMAWLAPTEWYNRLTISVQNANDETAASFGGVVDEDDDSVTIAGRTRSEIAVHAPDDLLWLARWQTGVDIDRWTVMVGASALVGPNATGPEGRTAIYGVDAVAKWTAPGARHGFPYLQFEGEAMRRHYEADNDPVQTLPSETLTDNGAYLQGVWGFTEGWAVGLRGEKLTGSGDDARADDAARDDRTRISPLLMWNPTHFSRLRLEYDYDHFDHQTSDGENSAHSVWLGLEVLIGAHPAHTL
jgi:hypothetical protein